MSTEISRKQRERLERLAAMPEAEINTSDIPKALDWRGAIRDWQHSSGEAGGPAGQRRD